MEQILFRVPGIDFPLYGFGLMLVVALFACTGFAGQWGARMGIPKERIADLAIWIFLGGVIGARITYMIQYRRPIGEFFRIWEGGIVFYGSAIGGIAGYVIYRLIAKRFNVSTWQIADIVAPTVAIGLIFGRVGCFLNGCCYGHVAGPGEIGVQFPLLPCPARVMLVGEGCQTAAGFGMSDAARDGRTVGVVEPPSGAAAAGLRPGDVVAGVNGRPVGNYLELQQALLNDWPRGEEEIRVTVERGGAPTELPPYAPRTLPLHPTQIYESVSMTLLFLVLIAYYPLRRHNGQLMVVLMLGYSVHRFLNEQLRNDTDPVALGLTLSQLGSVIIFVSAFGLEAFLRRTQPKRTPGDPEPVPAPAG